MKILSWKFYWEAINFLRFKGKRYCYRSGVSICTSEDSRIEKSRIEMKKSNHTMSWECWSYYGRAIM
jgi:hypothetical protein